LKRAPPHLAGDAHVRQERHLDFLDALAFAALAAPALGVEGEAARGPAAHPRLRGVGEQAPDRVPKADVRGGAGARRLADRRLVDFEHALDGLPALHSATSNGLFFLKGGKKYVAGEGRLPGSRDSGDCNQAAERDARVDVAQVVEIRLFNLERTMRT
jgi:hypothetical protein